MLASDLNNPQFSGAMDPDSALFVVFYEKSVQDRFKSEQEGRPIYQVVPYVRIQAPGNQLSVIDCPARQDHKDRFPKQWSAFENKQSHNGETGTPVESWPIINRAQADELKAMKFFTVEQIAQASDLQIQSMGMGGMAMREKARAYLKNAEDSALVQKQAAELAERDRQINELKDMVNNLSSQMAQLNKPKRKYTKRKVEPQT